jgi:spermidine/putrescine transport system permease protein
MMATHSIADRSFLAGRSPAMRWRLLTVPGRLHALPLLLLLAAGFLAPLLAIVWFSVTPPRTFNLWQYPTFESYRTIFTETFYRSFLWSMGLATATVAILAVICYPLAYAWRRSSVGGQIC